MTQHDPELDTNINYRWCLKCANLHNTAVVIGCYCMQVFSGSEACLHNQAFDMSIAAYGYGVIGARRGSKFLQISLHTFESRSSDALVL